MYQPTVIIDMAHPCYEIADTLIMALRESNGLEFMPEEQRQALILELSKPVPYIE